MSIAKIIITKDNLPFLNSAIDRVEKSGVKKIRFILPFKLEKDDSVPSLVEVVLALEFAKSRAREKGIDILIGQDLENNPFLPSDLSFFDTRKAELKINYKKHENKPKFSVIIPTHNRKNNLKFALDAFFKQDYPKSKYELIVIDDGSKDKTLNSIRPLKPTCNFKYFYWPRDEKKLDKKIKKWNKFYNRAGLARNIGINNSQGEIILFNDSDILVSEDCLKRHESYHDKFPNIIIRGFRNFLPKEFIPSIKKVSDYDLLTRLSIPEKIGYEKKIHCREYNPVGRAWHRIITANLSVRKKYLKKTGGFGRDFVFWGSEDVDLGYRLSRLNTKLVWDDKINVYHLYHPKESDLDLNILCWLGTNLLYRKYLDRDIYDVYSENILRRMDELIC